jgi:aryl-alcohol dehydrogenase-like predicted oxidoreductase
MMFGGRTAAADSYAMIDRAIDAGINFLDTANVYSRGRSEEQVGEALQRNGKRARVVLATKVHNRMDDDDPNAAGNSRRHIVEQCEASLRRLQTDYIDLYQIHRPDPKVPIDETLRALDDLVHAGKVRYIGASMFAAWEHVEALWVAKELHLDRFVTDQSSYHILDRRLERELLPMARSCGYGVIPYSPNAGGLLSGKYTRDEPDPADGRYSGPMNDAKRERKTTGVFDVTEALAPVATARQATLSQFSIAWVAQQPGVTSPIIGPRTMEQLEDNLGASAIELTAEELAKVDEAVPPGRTVSPSYNPGGGPHTGR